MSGLRRTVAHPNGTRLITPLLVPSFSSKGFGEKRLRSKSNRPRVVSGVAEALAFGAQFLTETMLLSAYDLHYALLGDVKPVLDIPAVLFIDSGGYETSPQYESGEVYRLPHKPKRWTIDHLRGVLDRLPTRLTVVAVSYDHRGPLNTQIGRAKSFFKRYPHMLSDFLIKPAAKSAALDMNEVVKVAAQLNGFGIIGVTEKELGNSVLKRLVSIARLRSALDNAGVTAPIHVFGSLDPLITPLYFAAGAEIFDGLSWLRYYYSNGMATYLESASVLSKGIQARLDNVKASVLSDNIAYIQRMTLEMRSLVKDGEATLGTFAERVPKLKEALDAFLAERPGGE